MIKERIANWLTGGELDKLRSNLDHSCDLLIKSQKEAGHYRDKIVTIYHGTKDVKHGTARKVARMCKEALE